jgi:phenylpyruvate tautomerase PptA (4-oxalocrotonate tautomerase family)
MPLIRIDAIEGRNDAEIKALLDAAHRAMLTAFGVPPRDRYQIYQEHKAAHMIMEDTGLGIERSHNALIFTVTSMPRTLKMKEHFYRELCRELEASCGIKPSDVMVAITTNTEADWSFGGGVPQFITGELWSK